MTRQEAEALMDGPPLIGPLEQSAREYLGLRTAGIPESQYLFALAELVRTRERLKKAEQRR